MVILGCLPPMLFIKNQTKKTLFFMVIGMFLIFSDPDTCPLVLM